MKRKLFWMLAVTLLLSGCWDKRELSTLTVVTGMAVDKGKDGKYKVSVEGINATELNPQTAEGNAHSIVYSEEGNTIAELAFKMNVGLSRNLIYSHMRLFVISHEIGKSGMMEFLDSFERSRDLRSDFDIIITKEEEAADILKVTYPVEKSSSLKLMMQLESASSIWGAAPAVKVNDFINALTSPGRQPVMTAVRIQGDPKKGKSVDNMESIQPDALVVVDSLALFQKDKLVGYLPIEDTRNYLLTQNEIKRAPLSVPCGKDLYASLRVSDAKTKLKGKIENGRPKIQGKVLMEGFLIGSTCEGPMDDPATYQEIEKLTNEYMKGSLLETIKKVQEDYGVDIFGFGEVVARQDYKNFKEVQDDWDKAFQEAEIDFTVDMKIRRAGIRTKGVFDRMK